MGATPTMADSGWNLKRTKRYQVLFTEECIKGRIPLTSELHALVYFRPYGVDVSRKNWISSHIKLEPLTANFKFNKEQIVVDWCCGIEVQNQSCEIKRYLVPYRKALGFHSLFRHSTVREQNCVITVKICLHKAYTAYDPYFRPRNVFKKTNKMLLTTAYEYSPQYEESKNQSNQSTQHEYLVDPLSIERPLATTKAQWTRIVHNNIVPSSKEEREFIAEYRQRVAFKPNAPKFPPLFDPARIREEFKQKTRISKGRYVQGTLTQCVNIQRNVYKPSKDSFNEYQFSMLKAKDAIQDICFSLNQIDDKGIFKLMPQIDCFPNACGRYLRVCDTRICPSAGFWHPKFDKLGFWRKKLVWAHPKSFAVFRRLIAACRKRRISGYCAVTLWRQKNQKYQNLPKYAFLKQVKKECLAWYDDEELLTSKHGSVMDVFVAFVDYDKIFNRLS